MQIWVIHANFGNMKTKLIILVSFLYSTCLFGQNYSNRPATLLNYGQQLQSCLENLHSLNYQNELNSFDFDITTQLTFSISSKGDIINIAYVDGHLSVEVKNYLDKLLLSTNGMWYPELKNCQAVISKKIVCQFFLLSKKISSGDRLKKNDEINEAILLRKNEISTSDNNATENNEKYIVVLKY
jgi:prepilin-type processing-associated H-X9-DG protein